jgi:hypothetical protein
VDREAESVDDHLKRQQPVDYSDDIALIIQGLVQVTQRLSSSRNPRL